MAITGTSKDTATRDMQDFQEKDIFVPTGGGRSTHYKVNLKELGMNNLAIESAIPTAESVTVTHDTLTVELSDGRGISVPLAWFPRLVHATPAERKYWRLIGRGRGIHWETLEEDISIDGLLAGRPSGESQSSFKKWLAARRPTKTRRATTRAASRR